jgi:hypothetical protein
VLCLVYTLLAGGAAAQKSATYDEPLHVASAWLQRWRANYQINPDQPPLWKYWIALALPGDAMNLTTPISSPPTRHTLAALYHVPPAQGIKLVSRARMISLLVPIFLVMLIACWAYELGGPVAAIAGAFAFVFDPNWLAQGALAKSDVAFTLTYFAIAFAVWRTGIRAGALAVIAILVLPAISMGTKWSGVLAGPVVAICLLIRVMMKDPWIAPDRRRGLAVAAGLCLGIVLVIFAGIWAEYGFRANSGLDLPDAVRNLRLQEVSGAIGNNDPTPAQLAAWKPGMMIQTVLWLESHKLVPQAWTYGFIYFKANDGGNWQSFLLGEIYKGGRWEYFPLAWLFKEPLALIAAAALAVWIGLKTTHKLTWTLVTLTIPPVVYAAVAMSGNLNVGLRHFLPVFPFIDIGIALAAAKAWSIDKPLVRAAIFVIAVGLATETLAAYPDFLSFFNVACGGERGGIRLLGDSNLDWGQDLPMLADWQGNHPDVPLYLEYFGTCDPAAYGIRYLNVLGGYRYGPVPRRPTTPGVAAISATKLQGLYEQDSPGDFANQFRDAKPIQVLGGSIYLFQYPPIPQGADAAGLTQRFGSAQLATALPPR